MTRLPFAMENIEPYTHNNAARVTILLSLSVARKGEKERNF
jgi:hypothetical protein